MGIVIYINQTSLLLEAHAAPKGGLARRETGVKISIHYDFIYSLYPECTF